MYPVNRVQEVTMTRPLLAAALAFMSLTPALALGEPVVWRDADTGCGYFLTPQGGMTIRYRADGTIDCRNVPAAGAVGSGKLDDMAKELGRGLDTLRREMERLRRGSEERL
jgi:hypothetical protein